MPLASQDGPEDVVVFDLDTAVADAMGMPVTEFNLSTRVPDGLVTLVDGRIDGQDVVPEDERCLDVLRGATLIGWLTRFDTRAEADEMLFESAYYDEDAGGCRPVQVVFGFSAPID